MKKFDNSELYQLLHIIKFNGNVKRLIRKNISYFDVINQIKSLTEKKFVLYKNEKVCLSTEGELLFNELSINYKNKEKDKWIEKEEKSKIIKLDIDFVYLPDQNKLFF